MQCQSWAFSDEWSLRNDNLTQSQFSTETLQAGQAVIGLHCVWSVISLNVVMTDEPCSTINMHAVRLQYSQRCG